MADLRVALEVDLALAPGKAVAAAAVLASAQGLVPTATWISKPASADGRWPLRLEAADAETLGQQIMQMGPVLAGLSAHSTVQAVRLMGPLGDTVHAGLARLSPNVAHVGMYRPA